MFKNYFKIILRNFRKQKGYHAINIGGLATGLTCCLFIALYLQHEMSYDQWMEDSDSIYRVAMEITGEGNSRSFSLVAAPVAPALKESYSQTQETLRLYPYGTQIVELSDDQEVFETNNIYWTEPTFFKFFTLELLEGDIQTALTHPNSVVISKRLAERYFGNTSALGKTLSVRQYELEVTGVMENMPSTTHLNAEMLISWATVPSDWNALENWHSTMFYTYIKLPSELDADVFEQEISNLADRYVKDELVQNHQTYRYFLQPVEDIHLYSNLSFEANPPGSITNIRIFSLIALLILVIASLNFVNLSTARSELRAKEVGMRKVIGANRGRLMLQFLGESILLSFLSLVIGVILFIELLPWYNNLAGLSLHPSVLLQPEVTLGLIAGTLVLGLGAGFYPALVLSSYKPINILRGGSSGQPQGNGLRRLLVVVQFAISTLLIVGTITAFKQINFMMDKELGFTTDQMLVLPIRGSFDFQNRGQTIKSEFKQLSGIQNATFTSSVPGLQVSNFAIRIDRDQNEQTQSMYHLFVDHDFTETYDIEIIAGRDFDPQYAADTAGTFIINTSAVKSLGFETPEQALGSSLVSGAGGFSGEIVGVFNDFHFRSVDQEIEPLVLNIQPSTLSILTLKLSTMNLDFIMREVEEKWASLVPGSPFDYFFLDEQFNTQYETYIRTGRIVFIFSVLAIMIASLGLLGLAAYATQQRTREIGIRKVLGATILNILGLLNKDFMKLVFFGFLIALPIAWFAINWWLTDFAYRIEIDPAIFLIAGGAAFAIAILTVSWQSIKAALMNPVESLRNE